MRFLNAFKKKPKAPPVPIPKAEPLIPPPPSPSVHEELPGFPKFEAKVDQTPELPSLSPELAPPSFAVPKPPTGSQAKLDENLPNLSPYELEHEKPIEPHVEQKVIQKIFEGPAPKEIVVEHEEVIPKAHEPPVHGPIYVSIDDYKKILRNVADIKKSMSGLNVAIAEIRELKTKEATAFRSWQKVLDDMKKKFLFVDLSLFETKG